MPILLNRLGQRKPAVGEAADPHSFESVGDIIRRMRFGLEVQMTDRFSRTLSLKLDHLLVFEQRLIEEPCDD
jgi:hypothetical protein